jgi:hypothetical protein
MNWLLYRRGGGFGGSMQWDLRAPPHPDTRSPPRAAFAAAVELFSTDKQGELHWNCEMDGAPLRSPLNPFAAGYVYIRRSILTDPLSIYTQLYLFLRPDLKSR